MKCPCFVASPRAVADEKVFVSRGDEGRPQEGLPAQTVAKNLVGLVNESKAGELASLEEVVASLVKDTLDIERDTVLDPEVSLAVHLVSVVNVFLNYLSVRVVAVATVWDRIAETYQIGAKRRAERDR